MEALCVKGDVMPWWAYPAHGSTGREKDTFYLRTSEEGELARWWPAGQQQWPSTYLLACWVIPSTGREDISFLQCSLLAAVSILGAKVEIQRDDTSHSPLSWLIRIKKQISGRPAEERWWKGLKGGTRLVKRRHETEEQASTGARGWQVQRIREGGWKSSQRLWSPPHVVSKWWLLFSVLFYSGTWDLLWRPGFQAGHHRDLRILSLC